MRLFFTIAFAIIAAIVTPGILNAGETKILFDQYKIAGPQVSKDYILSKRAFEGLTRRIRMFWRLGHTERLRVLKAQRFTVLPGKSIVRKENIRLPNIGAPGFVKTTEQWSTANGDHSSIRIL
jgi:hypothetical protein